MISVLVIGAIYVAGGMGWNFYKHKKMCVACGVGMWHGASACPGGWPAGSLLSRAGLRVAHLRPASTSPHAPCPPRLARPPPTRPCSELPNAAFWGDFNDLIVDGLLFVASGFRKPARSARKGGLTSMGAVTKDSAPLFSASFNGGSAAGRDSESSEDPAKPVTFGEL